MHFLIVFFDTNEVQFCIARGNFYIRTANTMISTLRMKLKVHYYDSLRNLRSIRITYTQLKYQICKTNLDL